MRAICTCGHAFKAKPTIDKRTHCPKCGAEAKGQAITPRDTLTRTLEATMTRNGELELTEAEAAILAKMRMQELRNLLVEVQLAFGELGYYYQEATP